MDVIEQYLSRSQEIIGNRTQAEIRCDKEVIRWLRKGKDIRKSTMKADKKYPEEALKVDDSNVNEVENHYHYLMEHDAILQKLPL